MMAAGLWQGRKRHCIEIHQRRQRRACSGELVQWVAKQAPFRAWDTSVHDWLEGRGERMYLVAMIDDATSRLFARFVSHDSTEENLRVLWLYLERHGRPVEFYTDKASLFEVTPKLQANWDGEQMPLTQITRALMELGIGRISAHSPQAKGRVERCFATAQDRLVKFCFSSVMPSACFALVMLVLAIWPARSGCAEVIGVRGPSRVHDNSCDKLLLSIPFLEVR